MGINGTIESVDSNAKIINRNQEGCGHHSQRYLQDKNQD